MTGNITYRSERQMFSCEESIYESCSRPHFVWSSMPLHMRTNSVFQQITGVEFLASGFGRLNAEEQNFGN